MPTVPMLTEAAVSRLPVPKKGSYYLSETGISDSGKAIRKGRPVPGFGVRVFPTRKTFVLREGGRTYTLGPFPALTVDEARTRARDKILALLNHEPSCPCRRFVELWKTYEDGLRCREGAGDLRRGTASGYRRIWEKDLLPAFGGLFLWDITPEAIEIWKRRSNHRPVAWNRALQQLHAGLDLALHLGWVETNAASNTKPFSERPSGRILSDDEISAWAQALSDLELEGGISAPAAAALWALFYSGARPGEILSARVSWVSPVPTPRGMMCRIDLPQSKGDRGGRPSGRVIRVPPPAGERLLEMDRGGSQWLIPGDDGHLTDLRWSFGKVCERAGITGATPKILRHVWRSVSPESGASRDHIRQLGGWSSTKVMDEVYAHSRDRSLDDAAVAVGGRLQEVSGVSP